MTKPQGGGPGNGGIDPLFRAVDAAQANAFRVGVVQDLDRVAIENEADGAHTLNRQGSPLQD